MTISLVFRLSNSPHVPFDIVSDSGLSVRVDLTDVETLNKKTLRILSRVFDTCNSEVSKGSPLNSVKATSPQLLDAFRSCLTVDDRVNGSNAAKVTLNSTLQLAAAFNVITQHQTSLLTRVAERLHHCEPLRGPQHCHHSDTEFHQILSSQFAQALIAPSVLGTKSDPVLAGYLTIQDLSKLTTHVHRTLYSQVRQPYRLKDQTLCTDFVCKHRDRQQTAHQSDSIASTKARNKQSRNRVGCISTLQVLQPFEGNYAQIFWRVKHDGHNLDMTSFKDAGMAPLLLEWFDKNIKGFCKYRDVKRGLQQRYSHWIDERNEAFKPISKLDPRFYPRRQTIVNWIRKHNNQLLYDLNDAIAVQLLIDKHQHHGEDSFHYDAPSKEQATDMLLVVQTRRMKELVKLYGSRVIFIDSTHGLNLYGYSTFLVIVQDNSKKAQVVAMFILPQETTAGILKALKVG